MRYHEAVIPPIAYIGPGAGFGLTTSVATILWAFAANLASILIWPFRALWNWVRFRKVWKRARVRKLIFIGFDGLDPRLSERLLTEGKLPHLARLRESGGYRRLRTTFPVLSPVAWSTFATGVNPARHNIFDFLHRATHAYLPELASAKVHKSFIEFRRKSEAFWKILGRYRIESTILRVPVTFPPEKFPGRMLSAMSTPDLKGTQGSFTLFSRDAGAEIEGGIRAPLEPAADGFRGWLEGPQKLRIPFEIRGQTLEIQRRRYPLQPRQYTPWIRLHFRASRWRRIHGIVRFLLTESGALYATPVEIDPERPALPVSHPAAYAAYLAKLYGTFATLGMAEDTWALNEGALSPREFLDQAYQIFEERLAMFRGALAQTRRGVTGCVFDTSDRVQHMFHRQMREGGEFSGVIEDLYIRMDAVVGEAMAHVDAHTALVVLSDHGFCAFNRGINLNAWLRDNGYLTTSETTARYFEGVDWPRTQAYALGLGGLYLNLAGREPQGAVIDAARLKAQLTEKLLALRDPETGDAPICHVYDRDAIYNGPYLDRAPDLVLGYAEGYRTAWGAAIGRTDGPVFETNSRAWSGDHAVDPPLVPGVLFVNRPIESENPGIEDLAPTFLRLFGVNPPSWMEGKPVF